jgi:hypothetical protein
MKDRDTLARDYAETFRAKLIEGGWFAEIVMHHNAGFDSRQPEVDELVKVLRDLYNAKPHGADWDYPASMAAASTLLNKYKTNNTESNG